MERLLFTNSNSRGDFVQNALAGQALADEPVFIATAFFTDYRTLSQIATVSRRVRLIVRLGFPTSPEALQHALSNPSVDVRYFTARSFHPKLYIFGDRVAYVGSANLTAAAMVSNQEIVAVVPADDSRLEELAALFGEYWEQASVLTDQTLDKYRDAYRAHRDIDAKIAALENDVQTRLGVVQFANIDRGKQRKSKENLFVESYQRTYQESVSAFSLVRGEYVAFGKRKVPEAILPLRVEIDSFFSFVRDHIATAARWSETPLGWTAARRGDVNNALQQWHTTPWPHLEQTIVGQNYPRLCNVFASEQSIKQADDTELFEALLTLHSFHDRLRFHRGGIPGLRAAFIDGSPPAKVRASLAYLVHGKGDIVQRMANLIYNADYKLHAFGIANVQELIGWYNNIDLPVINGRTTKILRYFGFDVRQLQ